MKERFNAEEMELFANGSDPHHYPNVDWQKLAMNTFAPEQRHTLTVTGGSEKVKAYTSSITNNGVAPQRMDIEE